MALEPEAATREDAQRRVDRIRAFREELADLERAGVVALDGVQRERLRRYHDETVASLATRFDVDATEAERRLSGGMRVASLLGAVALSVALYLFFFRFWGSLSTAAQVVVLTAAPLLALAGMEIAARMERTLYVAGLLGLVAVVCFALDLGVLGATFNVEGGPGAFLAWSLFAGLLAYAYGLPLLLFLATCGFTVFLASEVAAFTGHPWDAFPERPETLFLPGVLLLLMAGVKSPRRPGFPPLYRSAGVVALGLALLFLGSFGWTSYLPWSRKAVEVTYQLAGFAVAALGIAAGIRRGWREVQGLSAAFFVLLLLSRFFEWWWDWMPRWLFFLVIGALAVATLVGLRRVRTARKVAAS
jgi:uncharacterized membrane protein